MGFLLPVVLFEHFITDASLFKKHLFIEKRNLNVFISITVSNLLSHLKKIHATKA